MKFKINNREWTITEVSQQAIKNMQNIRKANEDEKGGWHSRKTTHVSAGSVRSLKDACLIWLMNRRNA